MSSINKSIHQMLALEELAHRDSVLHKLPSVMKLVITIFYIIMVISFQSLDLNGLLLFSCFPVFLMIISEIPIQPLAYRCMLALPFAFFAGISNIFFSRNLIFQVGGVAITEGMLTFTTLMVKTILTVTAVLLLMATTPMNDLIYALLSLHVPSVFVIQIMMTYRYLGVLAEEASLMYHAYLLRAPKEKGIRIKDIGPFLGQLILRSFDRAERIYQAMKCRGFEGRLSFSSNRTLRAWEWLLMVGSCVLLAALRWIN